LALTPANVVVLQRLAGNRAVSTLVSRQAESVSTSPGTPIKRGGLTSKFVSVLYDRPSFVDGKPASLVPFNTRVFVDRLYPGPFYRVTTSSGQWGYLAGTDVKTNLPEPSAQLHFVASGETPIGIAERYYKDLVKPGQDLRFYVNVLEYVNRGKGARGIYKPTPDASWDETQARANYLIWVPGPDFAKRLEGVVKSGSITGGLWARVKGIASAVADFVVGSVGFIGGLVAGALGSIKDLIGGLVELTKIVGKTLWSTLTLSLAADAKSLWDSLPSWKQIKNMVAGWLDDFRKKWHAPAVWDRWYFRGWVVGYAILEAIMMIFTGGLLTGAKWAGRAGRLAKALTKLPVVRRVAESLPKAKKAVGGLTKKIKAKLMRRASTRNGKLGDLVGVAVDDPAAKALAQRLGGRPSVRFAKDVREFDVVSDLYIAQSKPAGFKLGSAFRRQAKATFEASLETSRRPYFHFEGPPDPKVIAKLKEYGTRYGVDPIIDISPLG
jgi:hypothetical protein